VLYVMFYEPDPEAMATIPAHFPAHAARLDAFHEAGTLLSVGTFTDLTRGAMGIFTSREAVDDFMAGDPFVLNGIVKHATVQEWDERYSRVAP
jgi:uncharacterized protein YciI